MSGKTRFPRSQLNLDGGAKLPSDKTLDLDGTVDASGTVNVTGTLNVDGSTVTITQNSLTTAGPHTAASIGSLQQNNVNLLNGTTSKPVVQIGATDTGLQDGHIYRFICDNATNAPVLSATGSCKIGYSTGSTATFSVAGAVLDLMVRRSLNRLIPVNEVGEVPTIS